MGAKKQERLEDNGSTNERGGQMYLEGSRILRAEGGTRGLHCPICLPPGKVAKWVLGLGRHWLGCLAHMEGSLQYFRA